MVHIDLGHHHDEHTGCKRSGLLLDGTSGPPRQYAPLPAHSGSNLAKKVD